MAPIIPDRWVPYSACGEVIEGTKIVCFKVPLRKRVQVGNKEITEIWDIGTLLDRIPNLGAVIDLTNTTRYYDASEFQAAGVLYKKILMPGRIIPPPNKVTEFINTVEDFLEKDCGIIGVHCTHGLNRTGYMVVRYMRDRLGISAQEAISRFQLARGHKIERENYIADLLNAKHIPPPDFSKHTIVKPIKNTDEFIYTSPLSEDTTSGDNRARGRYGFNDSRSRNAGHETSWRNENRSDYELRSPKSWRDEERSDDNSQRGNSWRNGSGRYSGRSSRSWKSSSSNSNGDFQRNRRFASDEIRKTKSGRSEERPKPYSYKYDY